MTRRRIPEGEIYHFGGVRLRVTGVGNLKLSLRSLDDITVSNLAVYVMSPTSDREKLILANYKDQRGQIKISTTSFGETFNVSKMILFVKPIWSGYPQ